MNDLQVNVDVLSIRRFL